jgi:type IV conjugative transfer system coupling protein TraD
MKRRQSEFEHWLRGAEVFRHRVGMSLVAVGVAFLVALVVASLVTFASFFVLLSPTERAVAGYYLPARAFDIVGLGNVRLLSRNVEIAGERLSKLTPSEVVVVLAKPFAATVGVKGWLLWLVWLSSFGATPVVMMRAWTGFGRRLGQDEFRRGAQVIDPEKLADRVRKERGSNYSLAGVPIPRGVEMRNVLITGAMGTGKSVAMLDLAEQVAAMGRKMVIYDKVGEFTEVFYRHGKDIILNPFDQRTAAWNVFSEVRAIYDYDVLAAALIHDSKNASANEQFFKAGARALFAALLRVLQREGRTQTHILADTILRTPAEELAQMVQGTPAEAFITPKAAQQAGGVVAELVAALIALQYLQEGDFSIREWVVRDDDSRLFITSHESIHDAIRPLISMWIEIALRAAMARERTSEDRVWVFLDELPSLGTLTILKQSLVEARKYGVVHVVGLQNIAQLRDAFGKDVTQVLRSNLQNYLVLRVADEETAEAYSKLLGSFEQDERDEGLSFGLSSARDGSSQQISRKEVRLVMPAELQHLPDCTGYVQVAGDWPLTRVTYAPKKREVVAVGFLERLDLAVSHESSPGAGDPEQIAAERDKDIVAETEPEPTTAPAVTQPEPEEPTKPWKTRPMTRRRSRKLEEEQKEIADHGMDVMREILSALSEDLSTGAKSWGKDVIKRDGQIYLIWPTAVDGYGIDPARLDPTGVGDFVHIGVDGEYLDAVELKPEVAKKFFA